MPTTKQTSRAAMIERHESPEYDAFEGQEVEVVRGQQPTTPAPISIRLSRPLLEALDRLAAADHRKRSNLIQHILWEYVHAREGSS